MIAQPIYDLTVPWYCPTCDVCYGYSAADVFGGQGVTLHRIFRKPMRKVTKTIHGKPVEIWEPGRPPSEKKPGWFR